MRTLVAGVIVGSLMAAAGCSRAAAAGPNGGDVVPIKNGTVKAELVSNVDTGEVLVQTYDDDFEDTAADRTAADHRREWRQ